MTTTIIGLACAVLGLTAFIYSLPRGGKLAPFVGTNWEPYAVVAMISLLALGLILALVGIVDWAQ
jgi:hypothetical protein